MAGGSGGRRWRWCWPVAGGGSGCWWLAAVVVAGSDGGGRRRLRLGQLSATEDWNKVKNVDFSSILAGRLYQRNQEAIMLL